MLFLLLTKFIYSQNESFKIIDTKTKNPIVDVQVFQEDIFLTTTNSNGVLTIPSNIKEIILKKELYNDKKVSLINISSNTLEIEPITVYQLDEVVIKNSNNRNVFEKIYNVYSNRKGYLANYLFLNKKVSYNTDDCDFIKINELFYAGNNVKPDRKRILNINKILYNAEFYKSKKINIEKDSKINIISCNNKYFSIPLYRDLFSTNNFFYIDEIHNFFKNYEKIKHAFIEDNNYYSINYLYNDTSTKFNYKITLIVDKKFLNIINYKKELIDNKKNIIESILANTTNSQKFHFVAHITEITFNLNKDSEYELISESENIIYEYFDKIEKKKFYYNINIEPTIPVNYNKNDVINISNLIK